jgi:hypothetical protein
VWQNQREDLQYQFEKVLKTAKQYAVPAAVLIDAHPRFVDLDLFGILATTYSAAQQASEKVYFLNQWHEGMKKWIGHDTRIHRP